MGWIEVLMIARRKSVSFLSSAGYSPPLWQAISTPRGSIKAAQLHLEQSSDLLNSVLCLKGTNAYVDQFGKCSIY